ncbi:MAG: hypothetical protein LBD76_00740 [Prevotellaceae bacterium]|jgi:hypothetical protein|nr:hypothetical protein [Prevotellaceae bacterium]
MKSGFFLIGIAFCVCSCSLNEEKTSYYSDSFGVVRLFDNGLQYVESDEGEILVPSQSISSFVETGDRVWMSYTIEGENAKQDALTILPYRITRIMPLELQRETTLNNNGIDLWTVWIAQGFLTFDFQIMVKDPEKIKEHKYALVAPQREIVDTLFIDFMHDDGGDNYGMLCRTAVTMKLNNLDIIQDSVMLAINYQNLSGIEQKEYRMYKKTQK